MPANTPASHVNSEAIFPSKHWCLAPNNSSSMRVGDKGLNWRAITPHSSWLNLATCSALEVHILFFLIFVHFISPMCSLTPWPQRFPIWKGSIRLPVFNKSYIYCSLSGIQDVFNCAVYFIRIFIVSVSALITRLHSFWVIPLLLTLFSPYKSSYILVPDFADHEVFQQRQCKRHACNR